jgi:hypothetical protein
LDFIFKVLTHQPILLKDITINANENGCNINNKQIDTEKLLFLSIREKDDYKIIRLEMVRKNILIANEQILFTDVDSLEDGIRLCRIIKQFIHPDLRINQIKIGSGGASMYNPGGNRNRDLEDWCFIPD